MLNSASSIKFCTLNVLHSEQWSLSKTRQCILLYSPIYLGSSSQQIILKRKCQGLVWVLRWEESRLLCYCSLILSLSVSPPLELVRTTRVDGRAVWCLPCETTSVICTCNSKCAFNIMDTGKWSSFPHLPTHTFHLTPSSSSKALMNLTRLALD